MTATAAEPTLEEQVQGLKHTVARLAAERDVAFEMASQATKDQEKQRRELLARIKVRDVQIDSLRAGIDGKNVEIRRLTARVHELALANEWQQKQPEETQQESEPVHESWFARLLRHIKSHL